MNKCEEHVLYDWVLLCTSVCILLWQGHGPVYSNGEWGGGGGTCPLSTSTACHNIEHGHHCTQRPGHKHTANMSSLYHLINLTSFDGFLVSGERWFRILRSHIWVNIYKANWLNCGVNQTISSQNFPPPSMFGHMIRVIHENMRENMMWSFDV